MKNIKEITQLGSTFSDTQSVKTKNQPYNEGIFSIDQWAVQISYDAFLVDSESLLTQPIA